MALLAELADAFQHLYLDETPREMATVVVSAMVVYVMALWITRSGKHRFLGGNTVFDVLLGFILGSMLSRAINGGAGLVSSVLGGFVLIGLHFLLSKAAYRWHAMGRIVKGGFEQVVEDGRVLEDAMARHHITMNDLMQAARRHGIDKVEHIRSAWFERGGDISIVPTFRVRVVDVKVEEGVQSVRIEILD